MFHTEELILHSTNNELTITSYSSKMTDIWYATCSSCTGIRSKGLHSQHMEFVFTATSLARGDERDRTNLARKYEEL
jgi:predicted Zn-dependent protease